MKTNRTVLPTQFEPETRFDVAPIPVVPFRGTQETELEELKNRLLCSVLHATEEVGLYAPLRRAANEAAAAAWITPYPLLFLPVLFNERTVIAQRQFKRAQCIRSRSRRILAEII